jgi:hypothetical protein
MKRIKVVEKLSILKFVSVHISYMIYSKKLQNLQKRSQVIMRSKVKGVYGVYLDLLRYTSLEE